MLTFESSHIFLPCTCEIWSDRESSLPKIITAINDVCRAKNLGIICRNVSATVMQELNDDLVGSWSLEISGADGAHLGEDNGNLQFFLKIIQGQVQGAAPDFVRVRVIRSHSLRHLL